MKIRAGQTLFELPELVQPETCEMAIHSHGDPIRNPHSYSMLLQQVSFEQMMKFQSQKIGSRTPETPAYFCVSSGKFLRIYPASKISTTGELWYCPARKRF